MWPLVKASGCNRVKLCESVTQLFGEAAFDSLGAASFGLLEFGELGVVKKAAVRMRLQGFLFSPGGSGSKWAGW